MVHCSIMVHVVLGVAVTPGRDLACPAQTGADTVNRKQQWNQILQLVLIRTLSQTADQNDLLHTSLMKNLVSSAQFPFETLEADGKLCLTGYD